MEKRDEDRIGNWRNWIKIQTQTQLCRDHYQDRRHLLECKHITCDPYELKHIRHVTNKDVRYKQLPFGTVKSVCKLKLNRRIRGCRGDRGNKDNNYIKKPKGTAWQKTDENYMYCK